MQAASFESRLEIAVTCSDTTRAVEHCPHIFKVPIVYFLVGAGSFESTLCRSDRRMNSVLLIAANRALSRPPWAKRQHRRVQTGVGKAAESQTIQSGKQGLTICIRSRKRRPDGSPLAPHIHYRLIPGDGRWTGYRPEVVL